MSALPVALPMAGRSAARSEAGKVRRRNEDACLDRAAEGLWVVADGIGGHSRGDLASRMLVDRLAELPLSGDLDARAAQVDACLQRVNRQLGSVLTVVAGQPEPLMGSTVVALLVDGGRASCLWAGDSRCYLWRAGRLYSLTRDHNHMQSLVDEGMTALQAARHPRAQALTRAVGIDEALQLERRTFDLYPGDVLLLCSDGLYQSVERQQMVEALKSCTPERALRQLFELALRGPARDNLAAVVVRP